MTEHVDVFISSTFSDLEAFRLEIRNVIISLGMYPIDMVDFEPTSRNALQMCYDKLQDAEIFIGIYAHRYGYAPSSEISYKMKNGDIKTGDGETGITHWEYQWAQDMGMPCLLFLLDENAAWIPKWIDSGENGERLKKFKAHIMSQHIVKTFSDKEDLKAKVALALAQTMPQFIAKAESSWRALRAPEPPYYFAGRAKETKDIFERLDRSKTVLMTGMGGTGKTTLAKHIGKEALKDYEGGVLWLQLSPDVKKAHDAQIRAIAAWKEAHPASRDSNAEISPAQMKQLLSNAPKPLFAILDDAWSSDVIKGIRECLPDGTPLLITTRDVNLATPKTGERYELTQLSPDDALSFLSQRLNLNGAHAPDLREIGGLLGNHALALELVAAWLERESLSDIPALKNKLRHPKGLFRTLDMGDSRDENLEKALELSYAPLEAELQSAFRLLAALPSGLDFTPELAFAVWDIADDDEDKNDADDKLRKLARVGLLERRSNGRFFLHQTLHAYASKLIDDNSETEALEAARGRYHAKLMELARGFDELPMQDFFRQLEELYVQHFLKYGNELVTLDFEKEARDDVKIAMEFFRNSRKLVTSLLKYDLWGWLEKGLEASTMLKLVYPEAEFLLDLALYYANLDKIKALSYCERYEKIHEEYDLIYPESLVINNIAGIHIEARDYYKAIIFLEKALILADEVEFRIAILNNMVTCYALNKQFDKALEVAKQVIELVRESNDKKSEADIYSNLVGIQGDAGNPALALDYCKKALVLYRSLGEKREEAETLLKLGMTIFKNYVAIKQNNKYKIKNLEGRKRILTPMLDYYEEALKISISLQDKYLQTGILWQIALYKSIVEPALGIGNLDLGIAHAEAAVFLAQEIKHPSLDEYEEELKNLRAKQNKRK